MLLALERVGNVDNVGAIFRNAAAFGAGGVLLQADCADPLYRKAIRTSMAASLVTPYATAPWPEALARSRRPRMGNSRNDASSRGAPAAGCLPAADRESVAIVLGHEGDGLTSEAMSACTHRARIGIAAMWTR